jgi:hypothetical protein
MAWEEEIQKTQNIFGDVGGLIETGLGIFGSVKETIYPAWSQSPPAPTPTPEPIAAQPIVLGGLSLTPKVIIAALVIGYLLLAKK